MARISMYNDLPGEIIFMQGYNMAMAERDQAESDDAQVTVCGRDLDVLLDRLVAIAPWPLDRRDKDAEPEQESGVFDQDAA